MRFHHNTFSMRLTGRFSSSAGNDLAPQDGDYESRQRRWSSTLNKIDENITYTDVSNGTQLADVHRGGAIAAAPMDDFSSVLYAPGTGFMSPHLSFSPHGSNVSKRMIRDWIQLQKLNGTTGESNKCYFVRCIGLLNSLVREMIVTEIKKGKAEMELAVDPKLVTPSNLMVHQSLQGSLGEGQRETLHFIKTESRDFPRLDNNLVAKYDAMKALGRVAYELFMRGSHVGNVQASASKGTSQLHLSIDDSQQFEGSQLEHRDLSKRQRARDRNQGTISSTMMNAGVPYPLCRFVVDLLGGEATDGPLYRNDSAFQSFTDVLDDLNQMMDDPDAFLSVNNQWKLTFGEKMHGREAEIKVFKNVASRVNGSTSSDPILEALNLAVPQNKAQQIVMVKGKPGAGKSRLVLEALKMLEVQGWSFLSCKFERIVHAEPLSNMANAFDDYLKNCLGTSRHGQIRSQLKKLMHPADVSILLKHLPSLSKFIDEPKAHMNDFQVSREQIHLSFSQFIEVLSSAGQPVAFFADDLQWADAASIDLFLALTKASEPTLSGSGCSKQKATKLLFIGAYRDNEVNDNLQLVQMLAQVSRTPSLTKTDILVGGFDGDTLNKIVSTSLCLPRRTTKQLSEVILHKTGGIIIHIIEFMGRLIAEKILHHSFDKGWSWDSEVIESCPISESVAELFKFKLKILPTTALVGLKISSVFGTQIDQHIINFLEGYDGKSSVDINAGLKIAMKMGLVEMKMGHNETSGPIFKFSHDIIAQAAFDLIPLNELSKLLQKLVTALIRNATAKNTIDLVVFVVADLINRIKKEDVTNPIERLLYATMNDKAGKRALAVPDFNSAVKYSSSGLSFLDASHWKTHHVLIMSIYQTSIAALYSCTSRKQDLLKSHINEVLEHAKSLDEELNPRFIWYKSIAHTSVEEAISLGHAFLERLGEPIEASGITPTFALSELVRVKDAFVVGKERVSMQMTDGNKLMAMKFMGCLAVTYFRQGSVMNVIVFVRMVEMSMEHGFCEDSVFALACFGSLVVTYVGNIDEGSSYARFALNLMKQSHYNINILLPSVHATVYGFTLNWKEPIQATLDPILLGCRLGFDYGNISMGINNTWLYSWRAFQCGKHIDMLLGEIEVLARKCHSCGQIPIIEHTLAPIYNIFRSLKGLNKQVLSPLDRIIDNDEMLDREMKGQDQANFEHLVLLEMFNSFLFRNMEKAQSMTDTFTEVKNAKKKSGMMFHHVIFHFYAALTSCYFVRENRDRDEVVNVHEISERLQDLCCHSKWNYENKSLLIKAECHYTKGEFSEASKAYDAAISSSRNHRFLHEEALGCELAGYFYREQKDEIKSNEMFKHAHSAYMKWGAVRKADTLTQYITPQKKESLHV